MSDGFRLADILRVLGHRDRVRLVSRLAEAEKDVRTLCDELGAPQARVSQHLAVLRASDLVRDRRQGRRVLYRLAHPALAAWLALGGMALGAETAGGEEVAPVEELRLVEGPRDEQERKRLRK